jgi:hypothetical protein
MPPTRENRARITSQVLPMAHRVANEAALVTPGTSGPVERDRILVKLCLPRGALIEFVNRCRLGVVVDQSFPASGISHSGGPRAGIRGAGDVASPR